MTFPGFSRKDAKHQRRHPPRAGTILVVLIKHDTRLCAAAYPACHGATTNNGSAGCLLAVASEKPYPTQINQKAPHLIHISLLVKLVHPAAPAPPHVDGWCANLRASHTLPPEARSSLQVSKSLHKEGWWERHNSQQSHNTRETKPRGSTIPVIKPLSALRTRKPREEGTRRCTAQTVVTTIPLPPPPTA